MVGKGDRESSNSDSDPEGSSSSGTDVEDIETLIEGRAKRSTAGNRLSTLLDKEADDELGLLFAEDEEDVEFDDASGDDSDVQLESSSDDGEQGPTTGQGDAEYEGERELQKQDRAERQAKKRKAQDAFLKPPGLRKKVKVDPTMATEAPATPAPRPKKKSERISWIPTPDEGPTRSSSRKLTVQNKEVIHARMKESEKRRLKQIAIMEAAAKRKESTKPKALTQADRLAEAERTEKKNSKSLNRWEEAESKRSEEQRAKLAALHNRRLEGPVMTWWSGLAQWINGRLGRLGRRQLVQEVDDKSETDPSRKQSAINVKSIKNLSNSPVEQAINASEQHNSKELPHGSTVTVQGTSGAAISLPVTITPLNGSAGFLDGIHYYASLPEHVHSANQQPTVSQGPPQVFEDEPDIHAKPKCPVMEKSTRNLVILENFDPIAVRNLDVQRRILFKSRAMKPNKPVKEQCVITGQPAKFRDPSTGLPYLNPYAYKEIHRLKGGSYRWSSLLGCYVGPTGVAARGVPEKFYWKQNAPIGRRAEGA
ncbi:MAG: hypothetical protein M1836_001042 [Candelina mexicana]|nr:MAG: hypothetical protein M1836_001042 [Candelina mexicana]